MIRVHGREAIAAARAAQDAFRRAGARLAQPKSKEERKGAVAAFLAAREALLAIPAAVLAEAAGEAEAERAAAKHERRNPGGAERLRRWASR